AAATDESTPPDMPTMMREDIGLMILGAPAQQFGEPLELLGVGVTDLDRAGALDAADPHARHERALQSCLDGRQLGRTIERRLGAPDRAARRLDGPPRLLGRPHRTR